MTTASNDEKQFRCCKCGTTWAAVTGGMHECRMCGSVYVEWVNSEGWLMRMATRQGKKTKRDADISVDADT